MDFRRQQSSRFPNDKYYTPQQRHRSSDGRSSRKHKDVFRVCGFLYGFARTSDNAGWCMQPKLPEQGTDFLRPCRPAFAENHRKPMNEAPISGLSFAYSPTNSVLYPNFFNLLNTSAEIVDLPAPAPAKKLTTIIKKITSYINSI